MDPTLIAPILQIIAAVCFFLATLGSISTRRKLNAERKALKDNPPMLKCNICGLTLLSDDEVSQEIHVLCVLSAQKSIEARNYEKMWADAHRMNREFDAAKERQRRALEAPKQDKFSYKTELEVWSPEKGLIDSSWSRDYDANKYYRYHWYVYKNDELYENGVKREKSDAASAARALIRLLKKTGEKVVID